MDKLINRKIQPASQAIKSIDLKDSEHLNLDNGLSAHLLNLGTQDLVKIELVCNAGIAFQEKRLISSFTNKMLAEGTSSFSAYEIAESFDRYGAYFNTHIDKDFSSIAVYCLNKHLDHILPILTEIICEPSFPEEELSTLTNKTKQEFIISLKKVKALAHLNFSPLIFGDNHPYGQMASIEDFDHVKKDDLQSFYKNHYLNKDCKLFISGKLNDKIIHKISRTFGNFKIYEKNHKFSPDFSINKPSIPAHKISVEDALQSAIWIGKKTFNKLHPDFIGLQILNTILGGYFGSRLMTNIREDKGYTYGIGSSIVSHINDGYFAIQTEVGSKHTEATISEIYYEIQQIQDTLVKKAELDLIKNYIAGQLTRSMDGPFAVHEKLKSAILYGLDLNYYQRFIDELMNVTPEKIQQIANKHLQKSSLTELVVGK